MNIFNTTPRILDFMKLDEFGCIMFFRRQIKNIIQINIFNNFVIRFFTIYHIQIRLIEVLTLGDTRPLNKPTRCQRARYLYHYYFLNNLEVVYKHNNIFFCCLVMCSK